jgi:hypothetical protein
LRTVEISRDELLAFLSLPLVGANVGRLTLLYIQSRIESGYRGARSNDAFGSDHGVCHDGRHFDDVDQVDYERIAPGTDSRTEDPSRVTSDDRCVLPVHRCVDADKAIHTEEVVIECHLFSLDIHEFERGIQ